MNTHDFFNRPRVYLSKAQLASMGIYYNASTSLDAVVYEFEKRGLYPVFIYSDAAECVELYTYRDYQP